MVWPISSLPVTLVTIGLVVFDKATLPFSYATVVATAIVQTSTRTYKTGRLAINFTTFIALPFTIVSAITPVIFDADFWAGVW